LQLVKMIALICLIAVSMVTGHQVCYKPYGCFGDEPPFTDPLVQLPENPTVINTNFWLYTRTTQQADQGEKLDPMEPDLVGKSKFDPKRRTVIILHGFMGNIEEFWTRPLIDELLLNEDYNLIFVDAKRGLQLPYHQSVGNSRVIGQQLTLMVQVLKKAGANLTDLHCIGLGSGAHICGYLGRNLRRTNESIARITGLDPSGPYFENRSPERRLDETDADFVDVIHTDTTILLGIKGIGSAQAMGHIDYYPNGGYRQPDCLKIDDGAVQLVKCSHYRSVVYFTESINNKQCPGRAYKCATWDDFANGLCARCPKTGCPLMGFNSIEHKGISKGKYYLQTEQKMPYCSYHYNIAFYTSSKTFAALNAAVDVTITGEDNVSEPITVPRHYYKSGTTDAFLIHSRHKLGKLLKVKVSHQAYIDSWALDAVVIRPMWTDEVYTGCYQKWLNTPDNEVYLKTGVAADCPLK